MIKGIRYNAIIVFQVCGRKKLIIVSKVLCTFNRLTPLVAHIGLCRHNDNEFCVHFLGTAHRGKRFTKTHNGVHKQMRSTIFHSSLKRIYSCLLIRTRKPHTCGGIFLSGGQLRFSIIVMISACFAAVIVVDIGDCFFHVAYGCFSEKFS